MDFKKGGVLQMYKFNTIEEAIQDIKDGKIIVVVDNEDRENEGDLLMAAEKAEGKDINFMATHGRGLICTPIDEAIADRLNFHPMVETNTDNHGTAFTVSVDWMGTTTGISAFERADTVNKIIDEASKPEDFKRPGHVFPLVAKKGGVLERPGHTEAAVDLPRLAGLKPAGVICEIMNDDGTMARVDDLMKYSEKHGLKIITIEALIEYLNENR